MQSASDGYNARMNSRSPLLCIACLLIFIFAAACCAADAPRIFESDGAVLAGVRTRALAGDAAFAPAMQHLTADADKALDAGPFTVTQKKHPLPNGDPHDYVSLAPYFWPNPNTPDGLPYVRHDGLRNPEVREYDDLPFGQMKNAVSTLALAYYLSGKEAYADHATLLLRAWFFDDATRMNPNLTHAQLVKGVNDGRGTGIIESRGLLDVIDAAGLLHGSKAWTDSEDRKLHDWFADFVKWMRDSKNGRAEESATNNHGSWYDVQLAGFLLYLGDDAGAKQVIEAAKKRRIDKQIEPDGTQPLELARTNSFGYSCFNLEALTTLADLGNRVGVDLWNYRTRDGRGIRAALDWLLPYATGESKWTHKQIKPLAASGMVIPLRRAIAAYHDPRYQAALTKLTADSADSRDALRFPAAGK
jgi:hypothetical protein